MSAAVRRFAVDMALNAEVTNFLHHEAELLDERRHDEWLALYPEDAIYSIPQDAHPDYTHRVSISYDDHRRLVERVIRLKSGYAYAQEPASRTVHLVGNVRILEQAGDCVEVSSNLVLTEVRRGGQQVYSGRVRHSLRASEGSWLIVRKEIRLVNSELPLGNLSFLI